MDKHNKYINDALGWVRRSVALFPNGNNLHVYALLLYKNGNQGEAVEYLNQAINRSRLGGMERKEWYPVLEKMKKGELLLMDDD